LLFLIAKDRRVVSISRFVFFVFFRLVTHEALLYLSLTRLKKHEPTEKSQERKSHSSDFETRVYFFLVQTKGSLSFCGTLSPHY